MDHKRESCHKPCAYACMLSGKDGKDGKDGSNGRHGRDGRHGEQGPRGERGHQGECGSDASIVASDFYNLMPAENTVTVAPGTDVPFPLDGDTDGTIVRSSASTFMLDDAGLYSVQFQVSVTEPGQLVVVLNGVELAKTLVGRATGTSQLVGMNLIRTTVANSVLSIRNPAGESTALTLTPLAGGVKPTSAHLVLMKLS